MGLEIKNIWDCVCLIIAFIQAFFSETWNYWCHDIHRRKYRLGNDIQILIITRNAISLVNVQLEPFIWNWEICWDPCSPHSTLIEYNHKCNQVVCSTNNDTSKNTQAYHVVSIFVINFKIFKIMLFFLGTSRVWNEWTRSCPIRATALQERAMEWMKNLHGITTTTVMMMAKVRTTINISI